MTTSAIEARHWMARKSKPAAPFFPTANCISPFLTDVNELPYPRFYRGRALTPSPIVWEREAGYNTTILQPSTYTYVQPQPDGNELYCFQAACNTIFPCNPATQNSHFPSDPVSISP